jgi:hypothetical protein
MSVCMHAVRGFLQHHLVFVFCVVSFVLPPASLVTHFPHTRSRGSTT